MVAIYAAGMLAATLLPRRWSFGWWLAVVATVMTIGPAHAGGRTSRASGVLAVAVLVTVVRRLAGARVAPEGAPPPDATPAELVAARWRPTCAPHPRPCTGEPLTEYRAHFDAEIDFVNREACEPRASASTCRRPTSPRRRSAELLVRHLGLALVGRVALSNLEIVEEAHRGSRGVAEASTDAAAASAGLPASGGRARRARRPQPPDPRRARDLPGHPRTRRSPAPHPRGLARAIRARHRVRHRHHHDGRQHRHLSRQPVPPATEGGDLAELDLDTARRPARRGLPPRLGRPIRRASTRCARARRCC